MKVRIIIESTWKGPAKRDGVAMWLVEYIQGDVPITRKGFIHLENGTEAQGCLMALINAYCILKKPCETSVITQCGTILNTMQNGWLTAWEKNGWKNAKGNDVKNQDLWKMLMEKQSNHTYTIMGGFHDYQKVMQAELEKAEKRWKSTETSET